MLLCEHDENDLKWQKRKFYVTCTLIFFSLWRLQPPGGDPDVVDAIKSSTLDL